MERHNQQQQQKKCELGKRITRNGETWWRKLLIKLRRLVFQLVFVIKINYERSFVGAYKALVLSCKSAFVGERELCESTER